MARHGENIRKRADGRWEGRYRIYDEDKERYRYRSVYGRSYQEAKEKKIAAQKTQAGYPLPAPRSGILFAQAAKEWLTEISDRRKYSTYVKYETIYRVHLSKAIGACRLSGAAPQKLWQKIADHLSGQQPSKGTPSLSMQKSVLCVANQILAFANRKYAADIPLLPQPSQKAKEKAVHIFSRAEQTSLLACLYGRTDHAAAATLLCLHTGLRLGELCALKWSDIDFAGMTLTVGRTVQRIAMPGCGTRTILLETAPKNDSSRRTIPLTAGLLAMLSHLHKEDDAQQPYHPMDDHHDGNRHCYVFGGVKPQDPRTMQYQFQKILAQAGLERRNFHLLRHTFATNCAENGMDVKTLSELLGHSNIKTTLSRYIHPTMDEKRRQMRMLSDFYGQIGGQAA